MAIFVPKRDIIRVQPSQENGLSLSSALLDGLSFAATPFDGFTRYRQYRAATTNSTLTGSQFLGRYFNGSVAGDEFARDSKTSFAGEKTVFCVFNYSSSPSSGCGLMHTGSGSSVPFDLELGGNASNRNRLSYYRSESSGGQDGAFESTVAATAGTWNYVGYRVGQNINSASTFFVNGQKSAGVATYNGTGGNYVNDSSTSNISVGSFLGGGGKFTGTIALALIWNRQLSDVEFYALTENPWQIFESKQSFYFLGGGAGGDVTLSLTGQSFTAAKNDFSVSSAVPVTGAQATFANGTLASLNLASLTGQSSATQQGNLSPQTVLSLLGQAGTLTSGTLTATSAIFQALTGLSATASQGLITAAIQAPLSGQAGTVAKGTLSSSTGVIQALTGLSATASQGAINAAITSTLAGLAAATAQGTISPLTGILVALTGQQASVVNGAIKAALNAAATGISATTNAGSLTGNSTKAISGNSVTSALGSATPFISVGTSGMSIAFSQGNLIVVNSDIVLALTGKVSTVSQGSFVPGLTKGVTGQSITVDQGTLFSTLAVLPSGQSVTLLQGTATLTLSRNLTGQAIVTGQGSLVFSDNNVTLSLTGQEIVTSQGKLYIGGGTWAHTTRVYAGGKNLTVITLNQKGKIIALS